MTLGDLSVNIYMMQLWNIPACCLSFPWAGMNTQGLAGLEPFFFREAAPNGGQ